MDDRLIKELREAWKSIELNNDDTLRIGHPIKNFNKFMISLLERENDKAQIDAAESIYKKVLLNLKDIPLGNYIGYPAYDLLSVLGESLIIVFGGKRMGTTDIEINGKKTPAIVVGSEIFKHEGEDSLYDFWTKFKPHIIHELVHLNDQKRADVTLKSDPSSPFSYYNSPTEFNAYYLEIASVIYSDMSTKRRRDKVLTDRVDFLEYAWGTVEEIVPGMRQNLSHDMLFKWNKRLYQLFDELKKEFSY